MRFAAELIDDARSLGIRSAHRPSSSTRRLRHPAWFGVLVLLLLPATTAHTANVDPAIIANPASVSLDRSSTGRWQSLFRTNPAWITRQIAYLETRQSDLRLSLLLARLLYQGEPWTRRDNETVGAWRWRQDTLETRQAILRALRAYREPIVADHLCRYLTIEEEPTLVMSALVTLALIDPVTAQVWSYRLADPRSPQHLPGSASTSVRQQALEFLIETRGLDTPESKNALDWALLRVTGAERNHALRLLNRGDANDLVSAAVIKLAQEYRGKVVDPLGKQGLVLAISTLRGYARAEMVQVLMDLVVHGERAVATTAASALATTLAWDAPVAVNDLIERAKRDPDAVVRLSLTAFLLRLDPLSVLESANGASAWTALAGHQMQLNQWAAPVPLTTTPPPAPASPR